MADRTQIPEPGRWLVELDENGALIVLRVRDDDTIGVERHHVPGINTAMEHAIAEMVAV